MFASYRDRIYVLVGSLYMACHLIQIYRRIGRIALVMLSLLGRSFTYAKSQSEFTDYIFNKSSDIFVRHVNELKVKT